MLGAALSTPITQSLNATTTIAMLYPTHRLLSLKVLFCFLLSSSYFLCFLFYTRILYFEPSGKYQRIFLKRHYFYQGSPNQYKAIFWAYLGSCSHKQSRYWLLSVSSIFKSFIS
ncbi:hypothetical protein ACSQ67_020181 [Phaseolus vulgaris]